MKPRDGDLSPDCLCRWHSTCQAFMVCPSCLRCGRCANHAAGCAGCPGPDENTVTCPTCHAQQDESECFRGRLGWLTHYRCRYCGQTFSASPLGDDISRLASPETQ